MAPFASLLARHLARLGWSQRDLAQRLGLRQPAVAQWSNGRRPVPEERVEALADILGLTGSTRGEFVLAALLTGAPATLHPMVEALVKRGGGQRALVALGRRPRLTPVVPSTETT